MKTFCTVLALACLVACTNGDEKRYSDAVVNQCEKDRKQYACKEECAIGQDGTHRLCYRDRNRKTVADDPSWQCYGTHVGDTCKPCEEIYAINYAGALKKVTCEEFYKHIAAKNKRCNNCLEQLDEL